MLKEGGHEAVGLDNDYFAGCDFGAPPEVIPTLGVDLRDVTRADSAGLALLVEWLRESEHTGNEIVFTNVPDQLLSIARVCGLDEILSLV